MIGQMKVDEMAKNILIEKTCDTCSLHFGSNSCFFMSFKNDKLSFANANKDGTCVRWTK